MARVFPFGKGLLSFSPFGKGGLRGIFFVLEIYFILENTNPSPLRGTPFWQRERRESRNTLSAKGEKRECRGKESERD
jgi:hypothetical protein